MKKDIHNLFRTTLKLGIILLFIIAAFSSTSGVYVDTDVQFEIDSPLETYTFAEPMDFSRIIIAPTYIVFNTTGFNVTSATTIEIRIDDIVDDVLYPDTVDEELVAFTTVGDAPGITWFNISGFTPNLYYNVSKNAVFYNYYQANGTGSISIYDADPGASPYIISANGSAYNPVITTTGTATGITNNSAILYADLVYDGGEACDVWIEYGTTTSYGSNSTYNATKTTGGEFLYDLGWGLQNPTYVNDDSALSEFDFIGLRFQRFNCYGNINISYINYSLSTVYTDDDYDIKATFNDYPGSITWSDTTVNTSTLSPLPSWKWVNFKFDPSIQLVDIHEDSGVHYGFNIGDVSTPSANDLRVRMNRNNLYTHGEFYSLIYGAYNYDIRFIINNGTSYRTNLSAGQLYHYRAVANNSNTTAYGSDAAFLTLPNVTSIGYANSTGNFSTMNISFIPGDGANFTIIERNTTAGDWGRGDATEIYNGTGTYFVDTGLTRDTAYYYRLWSVANWTYNPTVWQYSSGSGFYLFNTTASIDPPYNGSSTYFSSTQFLNLSWSRGNFSDREIVVKNNDTWAINPGDGWVRQNSTNTWFNVSDNESGYYTIWSYNSTENIYSLTGLNIPWAALAISCFSENDPSTAIVGWSVEISNSDFTTTYAATNLTNIHFIDILDIPYGDDTIFLVSNSSFETRSYTYDIDLNTFYNLTFYLPLSLPPGGTSDPDYDNDTTYAEDYVIHVVGPQTEYGVDPPIEDAEVIIRKYINTTEQYENIGVYVTSADGTFTVPLLPNNLYSFNLSATGYYDEVESWMPVEIVFEGDRHHTFRLAPLSGDDVPGVDYDIFWDTVTFTAAMNDIDGLNGTITITYSDSNLSTTNTQIYVYEYYNDTLTLMFTISNTSENSFTYTTGVINTTRLHTALLYFNNTANFDVSSPVSIQVYNSNIWTERTPFDMDDRFTPVFGSFDLGYENLIAASLAIIVLCMFGVHNTGIGILACGFTLGFTSFLLTMLTGGFNTALVILIPVVVIIGGVYMLVKDPGGHL